MHDFYYKNGTLHCEEVAVEDLVAQAGTPLYIYSQKTIVENIRRLEIALAPLDPLICYAIKANSSLGILHLAAKMGTGFDVVSLGELLKVRQAGGDTHKCVFAGVAKTIHEITESLKLGIYAFNIESIPELERINEIAGNLKLKAPIAIRVNPNVDAGTHSKITTGTYKNKFGIAFEEISDLYSRIASEFQNIYIRGIQMHIGSQITQPTPFVQSIQKMVPLVEKLRDLYNIEFFSIGGGIGIAYQDALQSGSPEWWQGKGADFMSPEKFAQAIIPLLQPLGLKILLEPGRFIVGNAGILVTEVQYVKQTPQKNFVVVDAGMNDLIRPALYDSYHEIIPVEEDLLQETFKADVVGPICESADTFCQDREIAKVEQGDYLVLMSAGAYGMTMACNYNGRPIPAEVIVNHDKADYLRLRESIQTTWRYEGIPEWLLFEDEKKQSQTGQPLPVTEPLPESPQE